MGPNKFCYSNKKLPSTNFLFENKSKYNFGTVRGTVLYLYKKKTTSNQYPLQFLNEIELCNNQKYNQNRTVMKKIRWSTKTCVTHIFQYSIFLLIYSFILKFESSAKKCIGSIWCSIYVGYIGFWMINKGRILTSLCIFVMWLVIEYIVLTIYHSGRCVTDV